MGRKRGRARFAYARGKRGDRSVRLSLMYSLFYISLSFIEKKEAQLIFSIMSYVFSKSLSM